MQAQTQQTERQRLEQQLEAARQTHTKVRAEYTTAEQNFINTERQMNFRAVSYEVSIGN
jgi:hypothetical protein